MLILINFTSRSLQCIKMNIFFYIPLFFIVVFKNVGSHSEEKIGEAELIFKRLFKLRREEQLAAVKRIGNLDTDVKQRKMVTSVTEKIFTMMRNNKVVLESSGFIPGESAFPKDENIREALANLLVNTALIGDIILRLPDISQSFLSSHNDWVVLLGWSLRFMNQTGLIDKQTTTLINLVSQEMNFTARSDDYVNPYRKDFKMQLEKSNVDSDPVPGKKKKKKKEIVRGPRMSSRHYGDL